MFVLAFAMSGRTLTTNALRCDAKCVDRIEQYLQSYAAEHKLPPFTIFDNLSPIVPVKNNFDDLLIPADHVSSCQLPMEQQHQRFLGNSHVPCVHTNNNQTMVT